MRIDIYENKEVLGYGKTYSFSLIFGKTTLVTGSHKVYKSHWQAEAAAKRLIRRIKAELSC